MRTATAMALKLADAPPNGEINEARARARVRLLPPERVAVAVAIGLLEVLDGRRRAAQLERYLAVELWERARRLPGRAGPGLRAGAVRRVHWQELVPGLVEAVVILAFLLRGNPSSRGSSSRQAAADMVEGRDVTPDLGPATDPAAEKAGAEMVAAALEGLLVQVAELLRHTVDGAARP